TRSKRDWSSDVCSSDLAADPRRADYPSMAVYARALFPRVLVVTAIWIIASGTITFAADRTLVPRARVKTTPAAPKPILIVPDVRSQTFVFAKGILEDGGFAWHVAGAVHGFATNRVVSQTPTPGTRVFDTGP